MAPENAPDQGGRNERLEELGGGVSDHEGRAPRDGQDIFHHKDHIRKGICKIPVPSLQFCERDAGRVDFYLLVEVPDSYPATVYLGSGFDRETGVIGLLSIERELHIFDFNELRRHGEYRMNE